MNPLEIDPVDVIRSAPPGAVIYGFSKEPQIRIDFLIREASEAIRGATENARFEARAGSLIQEGVLVSVVMFSLGQGERIFETFWDYYRHAAGGPENNIFCHMSNEPEIFLNLFGDSGEVEGVIGVKHALHSFFSDAIRRAESMPPWHFQAFEAAKEVVTQNYPEEKDLWEHLGRAQGQA